MPPVKPLRSAEWCSDPEYYNHYPPRLASGHWRLCKPEMRSCWIPLPGIDVSLSPEEIDRRMRALVPRPPHCTRGYESLFLRHIEQAHLGCDFDFLKKGASEAR